MFECTSNNTIFCFLFIILEYQKKLIMVVFQDSWLQKRDCNKTVVGTYAKKSKKGAEYTFCKICDSSFKTKKGFEKINQHAKGASHRLNLPKITQQTLKPIEIIKPDQDKIKSVVVTNQDNSISKDVDLRTEKSIFKPINFLALHNPREDALKAELLCCLDIICNKNSANSCNGKKELYQAMFPGPISEAFTLSSTKATYLMTDALAPYFQEKMLSDLQQEGVKFSLQFDETKNSENKKELQVRTIYWSHSENMIVNRHLVTKFIDRGTGESLFNHLLESLDSNGLQLKNLLTLGRDGPNVNKTVARLFDEKFKELKYKKIFNFGSCYLHKVNNAFEKAFESLPINISDLVTDIKDFFDQSDLRWVCYSIIQNEKKLKKHKFLVHGKTRWTTIGPAVERIIEQLPALEHYFLVYIPKNDKTAVKNYYYKKIMPCLENPFLKSFLFFT